MFREFKKPFRQSLRKDFFILPREEEASSEKALQMIVEETALWLWTRLFLDFQIACVIIPIRAPKARAEQMHRLEEMAFQIALGQRETGETLHWSQNHAHTSDAMGKRKKRWIGVSSALKHSGQAEVRGMPDLWIQVEVGVLLWYNRQQKKEVEGCRM